MTCDDCQKEMQIGDWPYCPHGRAQEAHGFEPYFDVALGQYVTGVGDIKKAMRPHWEQDQYIQLDHRDKGEAYYREMNERRAERRARTLEEKR
jgi:hypothetical protein